MPVQFKIRLSIVFTRWPRFYTKYFYEANYNVLNDFNSQSYEPFYKSSWIISMDYIYASAYNLLVTPSLSIYLSRSILLSCSLTVFLNAKLRKQMKCVQYTQVKCNFTCKCPFTSIIYLAGWRFCIDNFWEVETVNCWISWDWKKFIWAFPSFYHMLNSILNNLHTNSKLIYTL